MSIGDKDVPTFEISSEEDRQQIVAEVIAHAALQEAHYRQPMSDPTTPGRWKAPLALVVMALAAALAIFPPSWAAPRPGRLAEEDLLRGLRASLYIQATQLEAFRVREGRLPGTLDELEHPVGGLRYVRSNNRVYQLVATGPDGRNLVYDSAQPDSAFAAAAPAWTSPRGGS